MKLKGNKILITGGGSGIGLGLAERFIRLDNKVIVCGRRETVLLEAVEKHRGLLWRACDLTKEESRVDLFHWIKKEHSDLNVLINNAGIQHWMDLDDKDFLKKSREEIATNIEAPLHLTSLFINLKSAETLINVTSGLAFVPFTKVPVYSATKAFFHSFTKSAEHLLKNKNVEVIELIPPALNTDLGGKGLHDFAPSVADFVNEVFVQLEQGKKVVTFGLSEGLVRAGREEAEKIFKRMNAG